MPSARYWRILVNKTNGGNVSCSELQMRTTAGGSNVATGGTASASNVFGGGFEADKAFDGNNSTIWATATLAGTWIKYDFGSGNEKDIVEVTWRSRSDGFVDQNPSDFAIEYSTDDSVWNDAWRVHHTPFTSTGETRTFTKPTGIGACQHWAIRIGRGTGTQAMGGSEMDLAESNGGSDITGSRTAERSFSNFGGFPASNLFDNSTATEYSSANGNDPQDAGFIALTWAAARTIEEVKWRARASGEATQSPTRGWVERSSDNINFVTYWTFTTGATWTALEQRTFQRVSGGGGRRRRLVLS
jgi:hypothetical protein